MKFTILSYCAFVGLAMLAASSLRASISSDQGDGTFRNPVIYADVPDNDVIRVGDTFYMVSTTMHMAPGVPVMKSHDLVNWEMVNYVYDQLETADAFALKNGKNDYANGSWAANLRYDKYQKRFYVIIACNTTDKSYIFSTASIENGPWHRNVVDKCYDPGLLFDDTGSACKKYVTYGQGKHFLREILVDDKFDATLGPEKVLMENCNLQNPPQGLHAEGAHGYKIGDYYYILMIQGIGGERQEIVWRSKSLDPESFEGRQIFAGNIKDKNGHDVKAFSGVAQGCIVDTADGRWYSILFEDYGAVGRIPVLMPMVWKDGWPVLGNNGESVDEIIKKPIPDAKKTGIVVADEFDNGAVRKIYAEKDAGTGVTAGLTIEKLDELITKNASNKNLLANGDFETGDLGPWTVNGGDGLAKMAIEQDAGGNHVLKVTQRGATIAGPRQKLSVALEPGATYRATARVKYDDYTDAAGNKITAVDSRDFKITLQNGGQFGDVAVQRVKKGKWVALSGSYTIPPDANPSDFGLYIETTWVPVANFSEQENKEKNNMDFAVDDIIFAKDEFSEVIAKNEYGYNGSNLKLEWQWNHNPNNNLWSLTDRPGFLRLKSGLLANNIQVARNTLTQRTYGPTSSANVAMEVSHMKDGDVAGLSSFQNQYGFVGVTMEGGKRQLVMQRAQKKDDAEGKVIESIPLDKDRVYLKVDCDFRDKIDKAYFYYSADGKTWKQIGDSLQMHYDWPHFVGYRFGLFYYSTKLTGGCVDFDYFHVSDDISIAQENSGAAK